MCLSARIALNTFESICRIVRSGGRLLGGAQSSAGTGPAAIPDGNLIRDADIFVPRRDCIDRWMLTKVASGRYVRTISPPLYVGLLQSPFFLLVVNRDEDSFDFERDRSFQAYVVVHLHSSFPPRFLPRVRRPRDYRAAGRS